MTRAGQNRDLAGAVVLDAFATGLNVARALHRRGVRVALVAMGRNDVAQYSRSVSECIRLKAPPSPATLLELLEAAAPRWRNRVLIPASDLALETLSRYRDRLARHCRRPLGWCWQHGPVKFMITWTAWIRASSAGELVA